MALLDKEKIRKKMLRKRRDMKSEDVHTFSTEIMNKLKKIPIYESSKTIMVYLNFGNEVISTELIEDCLEKGKTVVVPFCRKQDMSIIPTIIKDLDIDIATSKMGYAQPKKDSLDPVDVSEIDLIILPGLAFDKKGYRVGFGAGYYDRFLGDLNFKIPTIGVAYDFQIVESFLKMQSYDIPVDYVMTEDRIIIRTE